MKRLYCKKERMKRLYWLFFLVIIFLVSGCKSPVAPDTEVQVTLETVTTPAFSPAGGTYDADQSVTISCATVGATIYYNYTTDGTDPPDPTSNPSLEYTTPISVAGDGTTMKIKALAVMAGMTDSTIEPATTYTINYSQVATPAFSPAGGTYDADQSVTISSSTAGAAIHYTTDGTNPTTSSPVYSTAISVAGDGTTMTIKALAVKTGMTDSTIASAAYTIDYNYNHVATPAFSPAGGTYDTDQS
jgi:hypothetical protein